MSTLTIYRAASPFLTIQIDEKTIFSQKLMGEHQIKAEFYASGVLPITIGDYVIHDGHNYKMNRLPTITKLNNVTYQYKVSFESTAYDLGKKLFHSIDSLVEYGRTGNANDFLGDIINNMNSIDSGWTIGSVDASDEKTIVFSNQSCWAALTAIAEAYGFEYSIVDKSISLKKSIGSNTLYTFEYGRDQGLYKVERQQVQDQSIVTRVWGYGSSTNILETYRNRSKRLVFEERYLENNTELYGVIEAQYTNNDIFPQRTAPLSAANNVFVGNDYQSTSYVEDTTLSNASGFDLNQYFIKGTDPLIVFKSGDLAGQEFVIRSYDPATQRIFFNPQSEEDGYTTPNPTNIPQAGDLYTLVNISQPQMYIDIAEASLKAKTQEFLDENSVPMVVYTVEVDPKYAKTNTINLTVGDRVTIVDAALGVNNMIRISGLEYPLSNPHKMKAYIADFVPYTLQERVVKDTVSQTVETRIVDRTSDELARRYAMRQRQLNELIFDSDGYFDQERIRPLSVETMYLSVGTRSQNFRLVGVRIMANYNGDPNRIYISSGELHHFEIPDEGEYVWVIGSALDQAGLDPNTPYYIYAVCNKMSNAGSWLVSASQLPADPVPSDGYYYFLVGIIYDVYEGVRDFDLTHGMTYINGRTITTGRIRSLDQQNFFDLDQNEFNLGGLNSGIDWNVTTPDTLTIRGALVQRAAGTAFPMTVFRGNYNIATVYYEGDEVMYNGVAWIYHNSTPASGVIVVEGDYWTQVGASAAASNAIPVFRGEYSATTDYYGTSNRIDIVYYPSTQLYYIAKTTAGNPFSGIAPTDTDYWNAFGASFTSVATELLFSAYAVIQNAAIRYFNGVAVGVGDLHGTVAHTQANATGTNRIDRITVYGAGGSGLISVEGHEEQIDFQSDLSYTCEHFVDLHFDDYLYGHGILVTHVADTLLFEFTWGEDASQPTTFTHLSGTLYGTVDSPPYQAYVSGQKQIDTVTLLGDGGDANIFCDNQTQRATWQGSRALTAAHFASLWSTIYEAGDVIVSSSGDDVIFTSKYKGVPFTGTTLIANVSTLHRGGIYIDGNDLWENYENNDRYGVVRINYKGYNGGTDYYRHTIIGTGRGASLAVFSPVSNSGGATAGMRLLAGGVSLPAMNTATRNSYNFTIGTIIYNSETGSFQGRTASGWHTF